MKVIHYINLFVTILHTSLLLTAGISALLKNEELLFYAAYSHFGFGVFQVVLSLICLFFIQKVEEKSRTYLFKYYGIVVVYFLIMYAFSSVRFSNEKIVMSAYFVIIPMIIAYYFLFSTKNMMQNVKTD